ncbi:hypothetical protein B0H10DRAFT_521872 [Mycena sp. CBHHK59/15]|nr:hypothetical protein B0H10DRAFT_521872 [Mycena sp. CBHHK59/15]
MSQRSFTNYVLPLVLFPTLSALALKFILGSLLASGLTSALDEQCPAYFTSLEHTPHRLPYVGVSSVDKAVCGPVFFFHLALSPAVSPFLEYFMGTAMPLLALPALESCRNGRHFSLGLPVLFGLLMQVMTVGVVLPIYWLLFILTGSAQRHAARETKISQAHAEAVIFGLIIGAGIPSICLLVLQDSYVTALWQLFPLWQFLAQSAHLFFRRPSAHPESAYSSVLALYIGLFIVSSSIHIGTLSKTTDLESIKAVFLPSLTPLTSVEPSLKVLDLLQWDGFFGFVSTLLGTVWFARTAQQAVCIMLWNVVGSVLVGPGAAIAAVALWRETHLHSFVEKPKAKEL